MKGLNIDTTLSNQRFIIVPSFLYCQVLKQITKHCCKL